MHRNYPYEFDANSSEYTLCSLATSSGATASDIAGAGRIIGLAYDRGGRALERGLGRLLQRPPNDNDGVPGDTGVDERLDDDVSLNDSEYTLCSANVSRFRTEYENMSNDVCVQDRRLSLGWTARTSNSHSTPLSSPSLRVFSLNRLTFCSLATSSNATASDIVGTGRVLGLVYRKAGRVLEKGLGLFAERIGAGPRKVAERIVNDGLYGHGIAPSTALHPYPLVKKRQHLRPDCQTLLTYAL